MNLYRSFFLFKIVLFFHVAVFAQHTYDIHAEIIPQEHKIGVKQKMVFVNTTTMAIDTLYVYDWNHSYSETNTPLGNYLSNEFQYDFQRSKFNERGYTSILKFKDVEENTVRWDRLPSQPDIIRIPLKKTLQPHDVVSFNLHYTLYLPNDQFTGYGRSKNKDIRLKNWYLTFAYLDKNGKWYLNSNINLNDMSLQRATHQLTINTPQDFHLVFPKKKTKEVLNQQIPIETAKVNKYLSFELGDAYWISDFNYVQTNPKQAQARIVTIQNYLNSLLGLTGQSTFQLTEFEYNKDPIHGLNVLLNFIKPVSQEVLFDLKVVQMLSKSYLENFIPHNIRQDPWLLKGLRYYIFLEYIETFYPNLKLTGNLSNIWGFKNYHLAKSPFKRRFEITTNFANQRNVNQPLNTPLDKLTKYNHEIANPASAGLGFHYLSKYIGEEHFKKALQDYVYTNSNNLYEQSSFEEVLKRYTSKNTDWFFEDYLARKIPIDFKIKFNYKTKDSINFDITHRTDSNIPTQLFTFQKNKLVNQQWVYPDDKNIMVSADDGDQWVLNYNHSISEQRYSNNSYHAKSFPLNNKLRLRLLQDLPVSYEEQIYYIPEVGYNYYDGILAGFSISNNNLIGSQFNYKILPQYGIKNKKISGSTRFSYANFYYDRLLYRKDYNLAAGSFHYAPNKRYSQLTLASTWRYRPVDLRSNRRWLFDLRFISIGRDVSSEIKTDPSYSLGLVRFNYSNDSSAKTISLFQELQVNKSFAKFSINGNFRKFYSEARQYGFRFFGGVFLTNKTNDDFFSFGVSNANDYTFSYNLFGRSESTGFFRQQFIPYEGGIKSIVKPQFSNDWIMSLNSFTTLWKWIEAYGDLALIKNKYRPTEAVYSTGIRLNLVEDYFEVYLPFYSSLGWEINERDYKTNIRFQLTLSPSVLSKLLTRKWF